MNLQRNVSNNGWEKCSGHDKKKNGPSNLLLLSTHSFNLYYWGNPIFSLVVPPASSVVTPMGMSINPGVTAWVRMRVQLKMCAAVCFKGDIFVMDVSWHRFCF